jgi:hypothetical protein
MKACVGASAERAALEIARLGFDGSPDLVLYRPNQLWLVEVKSATDTMRPNQVEMLHRLARIDGVKCSVICPASARKRLSGALNVHTDESE